MRCSVCGENLAGQPLMVDRITGDAYCFRHREHFYSRTQQVPVQDRAPSLVTPKRLSKIIFWWRLRQLKSKNAETPKRAIAHLAEARDLRAVESLCEALRDINEKVRRAAASLLDNLNWQPGSDERWAMYLIAKEDWEQCVALGLPAVGPLINVLKSEEGRGRWTNDPIELAQAILVKIGVPAVEPLIEALKNSSGWQKVYIADTLGEIADAGAIDTLVSVLHDEDPYARAAAVKALGLIGDLKAIDPLITALKDDESWVSDAAKEALKSIKLQTTAPNDWTTFES
jgi:HEAT repeat protein